MNTSATSPATPAQQATRARAAVVAAAGFAGLAGFETALAAGAPLGHAAWGGAHVYLPAGLRIASGLAAAFWALAGLVVLRRGGYRRSLVSFRASRAGTWLLAGLLTLGALRHPRPRQHGLTSKTARPAPVARPAWRSPPPWSARTALEVEPALIRPAPPFRYEGKIAASAMGDRQRLAGAR